MHHMAKEYQGVVEGSRSGGRQEAEKMRVGKQKKGFGYQVQQMAGLGNTTVKELLSEERYAAAVLDFVRARKWGRLRRVS